MNDLQHRKSQLRSLEGRLKNVIESGSDDLEDNLKDYLKVGAIVGVSLLIGFKVYRLLSPSTPSVDIKKTKRQIKNTNGKALTPKQRILAVAATVLYSEFRKQFGNEDNRSSQSASDQSN